MSYPINYPINDSNNGFATNAYYYAVESFTDTNLQFEITPTGGGGIYLLSICSFAESVTGSGDTTYLVSTIIYNIVITQSTSYYAEFLYSSELYNVTYNFYYAGIDLVYLNAYNASPPGVTGNSSNAIFNCTTQVGNYAISGIDFQICLTQFGANSISTSLSNPNYAFGFRDNYSGFQTNSYINLNNSASTFTFNVSQNGTYLFFIINPGSTYLISVGTFFYEEQPYGGGTIYYFYYNFFNNYNMNQSFSLNNDGSSSAITFVNNSGYPCNYYITQIAGITNSLPSAPTTTPGFTDLITGFSTNVYNAWSDSTTFSDTINIEESGVFLLLATFTGNAYSLLYILNLNAPFPLFSGPVNVNGNDEGGNQPTITATVAYNYSTFFYEINLTVTDVSDPSIYINIFQLSYFYPVN